MGDDLFSRVVAKARDIDESKYDTGYNIAMIGTSGVGKTVFMTTMLHELMMESHGQLRVDAFDHRQKQQVIQNYNILRKGEELPATSRHNVWKFRV
jgi:ABC-type transporter Mla maintaining outer membrane lipid asymmetry ATPase subunit MlaF